MATRTLPAKKLTKAQKRVAIAKDILKHMKNWHIGGAYISRAWNATPELPEDRNVDAQPYLKELERDCHVCALGACLLSRIHVFDEVSLSEFTNSGCADRATCVDNLEDIFSLKMLNDMESLFENHTEFAFTADGEPLDKIGWRFADQPSEKRLRRIAQNIIDNEGDLKPTQLVPSYKYDTLVWGETAKR